MNRLHILITKPILLIVTLSFCGFGFNTSQIDFPSTSLVQQSNNRILIVIQKTTFKTELARILSDHYTAKSIYTEVADFSIVSVANPGEWSAIVILQSWEDWQPQPEITSLIKRADQRDNILVVTTSDTGQEKLEGIDAISSASMVDNAQDTANKIIARLSKLL